MAVHQDRNIDIDRFLSVTSIDDMLTIDAPAEDANEEWKQWIGDRIVGIIERKGSNIGGRETSLDEYNKGLMKHYALDDIRHQTSELFPAFLKSVRTESSEKETCLALRGWLNAVPFHGYRITNIFHSYRTHAHHSSFRNRLRCHLTDSKEFLHRLGVSQRQGDSDPHP